MVSEQSKSCAMQALCPTTDTSVCCWVAGWRTSGACQNEKAGGFVSQYERAGQGSVPTKVVVQMCILSSCRSRRAPSGQTAHAADRAHAFHLADSNQALTPQDDLFFPSTQRPDLVIGLCVHRYEGGLPV